MAANLIKMCVTSKKKLLSFIQDVKPTIALKTSLNIETCPGEIVKGKTKLRHI